MSTPDCYSSPPARQATYVSGTEILASDVTANEDSVFNYLQAGVSVFADGSIVNADVNASANIQSDKLNLGSIAQDVSITSGGSFTNAGTSTFTGNSTFSGTTNLIGDGGSDTLTLNLPSGITFTPAATWTFTGNQTISGTWANLGTVTTVDINGGTLDGVQIGGTIATGELIVNNSSDAADGLGSQGTSGQILESAGAGVNPTWVEPDVKKTDGTTFSSTSVSITQTISEGDIYKLMFEGSANAALVSVTINSASSGYMYILNGSDDGVAVVTEDDDHTAIVLSPQGFDAFNGELIISARGSDTQVSGHIGGVNDVTTNKENYVGTFFGNYGGGTPTSIQLVFSQTTTGSYRLYKMN